MPLSAWSDPIRYTLEHVKLSDVGGEYDAVSYVWGNAANTMPIVLDGEDGYPATIEYAWTYKQALQSYSVLGQAPGGKLFTFCLTPPALKFHSWLRPFTSLFMKGNGYIYSL